MSVGPPLSGSGLAFACASFENAFIYLKHRRRRVKDLVDDFATLTDEVDDLIATWEDNKDTIERQFASEKNKRYTIIEKKLRRKKEEYKKIEEVYKKLCTDLESKVIQARTDENQTVIGKQKIWTRNFFKLGRLDKDVVKLKNEITWLRKELLPEGGGFTRPKNPKIVEILQVEELGDIVPSHQKHLEDLVKYVKQETCKRIGIYGPPGIGITNILKNLNNCCDASSPLNGNLNVDYVLWVPLSEENNEEKLVQTIQKEIIGRLKMTGGNTRNRNRDIISSFLSIRKYLLILDNFSPLVKLEDIGIQKDHENGKVVMAAKSSRALRNVQLDKKIEITPLSLSDARKLFKHFINDYDGLPKEKKIMVELILPHLGGLPGFIQLSAQYLNEHRELLEWKGIKDGLESDVGILVSLGMEQVIASYKKVYEDFEQNHMQKCLLYAALFPSKICISNLVECWKAENFLDCRPPTLNNARAAGTLVINQLRSSCLLESCCGERQVEMSVFFRKVAFDISFPGEGDGALCVRSRSDKDGDLEETKWKNARRVSLIRSNLKSESLPIRPQCDGITTLLLQHNPGLKLIKDDFFINMKSLRVLNLQGTGIRWLPSSVSKLIDLRNLYLNDCGDLNKLPTTINKLQKLEVLDIRGTSISCLPAEILDVVSLRCLRISFAVEETNLASGIKGWIFERFRFSPAQAWLIFPPDAHTKLPKLEEMTIDFKGEVSDIVRHKIIEEAVEFRKRQVFVLKLGPHPEQSFGPYSEASQEEETGELSNVVEEPARLSPSSVDERPAGIAPSTATVLQSNNNQIVRLTLQLKKVRLTLQLNKVPGLAKIREMQIVRLTLQVKKVRLTLQLKKVRGLAKISMQLRFKCTSAEEGTLEEGTWVGLAKINMQLRFKCTSAEEGTWVS